MTLEELDHLPALGRMKHSRSLYWIQAVTSDGRRAYVTRNCGVPIGTDTMIALVEIELAPESEATQIMSERSTNNRKSGVGR